VSFVRRSFFMVAVGFVTSGHRTVRSFLRRRGRLLIVRSPRLARRGSDAGMTTAEYAIGTVAACAFAAVLYRVVSSGTVAGAISELLDRALHAV